MSEETTRNLTGAPSFEERIFNELSSMRADFSNRFGALETRFDGLETRFDGLDARFERVESRLDVLETRFNRMETRFDRIETRFDKLETRLDTIDTRLSSVEGRLGTVEERLSTVEERLTSLDDKVDARLRETRPIWEGVHARLTEIESTLTDINRQFKTLVIDSFKLRVRVESLEDAARSSAT